MPFIEESILWPLSWVSMPSETPISRTPQWTKPTTDLLRLHLIAGEAREVVHQHDVELLGLGRVEQGLIARPSGLIHGAADGFIFIARHDRPAFARGPLLTVPELVGDGTVFLVVT